jgi:hypothetical protein
VSVVADAALAEVARAAEAALGASALQHHLAEIVTRWRLHPTPALVALCASRPEG